MEAYFFSNKTYVFADIFPIDFPTNMYTHSEADIESIHRSIHNFSKLLTTNFYSVRTANSSTVLSSLPKANICAFAVTFYCAANCITDCITFQQTFTDTEFI